MSKPIWRAVTTPEGTTITVVKDAQVYSIQDDHVNFNKVQQILESDDDIDFDEIIDLISTVSYLNRVFTPLSEHITISNGAIYYDGDLVDSSLTKEILRFVQNGDVHAVQSFVNFMDKLYQNTTEDSRLGLYDWMLANGVLTILENGNFIAYKGVSSDLQSLHAGYGIVNDVEYKNACLDNSIGNVVTYPRSKIDTDRTVACSQGLHVGTFAYAADYGDVVLACEVNPADVVTVPYDYDGAKIRVCRYKVVKEVPAKLTDLLLSYDEAL